MRELCALTVRLARDRHSCSRRLRTCSHMSDGRVLFVDHAAVLGGAELSLLDIATALRDRGSVVLFEHGPFEERLRLNDVTIQILGGSGALRSIKKSSK